MLCACVCVFVYVVCLFVCIRINIVRVLQSDKRKSPQRKNLAARYQPHYRVLVCIFFDDGSLVTNKRCRSQFPRHLAAQRTARRVAHG